MRGVTALELELLRHAAQPPAPTPRQIVIPGIDEAMVALVRSRRLSISSEWFDWDRGARCVRVAITELGRMALKLAPIARIP